MGVVNQWGGDGHDPGPDRRRCDHRVRGTKRRVHSRRNCHAYLRSGLWLAVSPGQKGVSLPAQSRAFRFSPRLYMLAGITLLDFLAYGAWTIVFTLWLRSTGTSESTIGALLTVQTFAYAVVQRFSGRLADAGFGIHAVMVGAVGSGVIMLAIPFVRSLWGLGALMLISGAIVGPALTAAFSGMRREAGEKTARAMGLFQASIALGMRRDRSWGE